MGNRLRPNRGFLVFRANQAHLAGQDILVVLPGLGYHYPHHFRAFQEVQKRHDCPDVQEDQGSLYFPACQLNDKRLKEGLRLVDGYLVQGSRFAQAGHLSRALRRLQLVRGIQETLVQRILQGPQDARPYRECRACHLLLEAQSAQEGIECISLLFYTLR